MTRTTLLAQELLRFSCGIQDMIVAFVLRAGAILKEEKENGEKKEHCEDDVVKGDRWSGECVKQELPVAKLICFLLYIVIKGSSLWISLRTNIKHLAE